MLHYTLDSLHSCSLLPIDNNCQAKVNPPRYQKISSQTNAFDISSRSNHRYTAILFNPLTLLDIRYFLVDLTWGGLTQPPPGKQPSGTFMSSNHLVTDQAHKNGQFYDLKWSKIIFNCKRDLRTAKNFKFFKNFK